MLSGTWKAVSKAKQRAYVHKGMVLRASVHLVSAITFFFLTPVPSSLPGSVHCTGEH